MKCENCNKEHDSSYGSGRFCNEKCARSFSTKKDIDRKTKIVNCIVCGKEIQVSKRASSKLCKCDNCRKHKKYSRENKEEFCLNCNKKLKDGQYKFCSQKCPSEYKYKQYIKKWKNNEVDGTKSNGNAISNYIRKYLFKKYNNKCSRCGWNKKNQYIGKVILEIEHIDGNPKNNKEENLDLICPNCHSLTPTYKALNKGNGDQDRLKYYKLK